MAEDKKSFVLYADLIHTVEKMPDDKAGKLLKLILQYVNDKNPEADDMLLDLVFEPVKRQLKRDLKKYEERKKARSEAGKLSAETKRILRQLDDEQQNSTNVSNADFVEQNSTNVNKDQQASTKSTGNVNGNVTVNDTVNGNGINKQFPNFPTEENLGLELPSLKIGAVKELLQIGKQISVDDNKVVGYWGVFKNIHFTGKKFYQDVSDVYSHFIHWTNKQTPTALKNYNTASPDEPSEAEKKAKLKSQLSKYDR